MTNDMMPTKEFHLQKGVSLIELMVSVVIGLVVSLAAASAYLGSRSTANAQHELSRVNEYGRMALEMIGRELQVAGYYPTFSPNDPAVLTFSGSFDPSVKSGAAYAQGLFGCSGAVFNPANGTCGSASSSDPDSIVINYFSNPELGAELFNRFDCLRQDTLNDPVNTTRNSNGLPLIISNRFALSSTSIVQPSGTTVTTKSLACHGNGHSDPADNTYQPIFEGLEDMVIRYGVHDGSGNLTPERFYTADEVDDLPLASDKNGWQRVASVRVCILARTLENTRLSDSGTARTYRNCRGDSVSYASGSGSLYKTFERTFAVRNNINGGY